MPGGTLSRGLVVGIVRASLSPAALNGGQIGGIRKTGGRRGPQVALTDTAIRNAKPCEEPFKLSDAGGLFLSVQPSGGKLWRLKFRIVGRKKKLATGTYPRPVAVRCTAAA
ncbi:Arm DNA-binding domain-containing protein [Alteripontixanthobacter muriae]|uniref:Arm DNA-binding domain-containing protein n=1 Tax=Alteripontixanthobacter muriae TaxID=2705546 RepID=UPI0038BBA07F